MLHVTPDVGQLLVGNSPPLRTMLTTEAEQAVSTGGARAACSSLARDAIDLFASPLRERIRVCDADDCGMLTGATHQVTLRWTMPSASWRGMRATMSVASMRSNTSVCLGDASRESACLAYSMGRRC